MLPYYIVFASLFFLNLFNHRVKRTLREEEVVYQKKQFVVQAFLLLAIFTGLRDISVGCDLEQYLVRYQDSLYHFKKGFESSEWLFNYVSYFFHNVLRADFQVFLFVINLFCMLGISVCIYKFSDVPFLSYIMFITLGLFTLYMSGLRQSVAITLALLAILQAEKKRMLPFALCIIAAYFFHNSAVVFLPVYFLWGRRISRPQAYILLGISLMAFFYRESLIPIIEYLMPNKYEYIDLLSGYDINILVIVVPIVICVACVMFKSAEQDGKFDEKFSFFFIMSCIAIIMHIASLNNGLIGRLYYYFCIGNIIALPSTIDSLKEQHDRLAMAIEVLVIVMCLMYFIISTPDGTLQIDKFKFFWQ